MRTPHPYAYETWKEQGKPKCSLCRRPVLIGYKHYCEPVAAFVRVKEPKRWPL